jgi:hypothetical protein
MIQYIFISNFFRFRINKSDTKKVFIVDLGIKCTAANIDQDFLKGFEIPIPICNGNFSLQGIKFVNIVSISRDKQRF